MSKKINAAITAVGGYVPEDKLTNKDLEQMVDTNDEWIRSRTGVEERRILKGEGKATSDMGAPAVQELCRKRGIDPAEIDCLICCTVTPDMVFPATANIICDKVGAINAWGFDLQAACSGFVYGITTGAMFIESGRYKKVVIVGADKMSAIVDYSDRSTCIIFGDGAGVVLIKSLDKAIGDRDHIYAVIKGSAINNDGAYRESYPAPSSKGQTICSTEALKRANIPIHSIGYVEAHGTGTINN